MSLMHQLIKSKAAVADGQKHGFSTEQQAAGSQAQFLISSRSPGALSRFTKARTRVKPNSLLAQHGSRPEWLWVWSIGDGKGSESDLSQGNYSSTLSPKALNFFKFIALYFLIYWLIKLFLQNKLRF